MATLSRRSRNVSAHLRRHFKKVANLSHGNNPVLGQVFLILIEPKGFIGIGEKLALAIAYSTYCSSYA